MNETTVVSKIVGENFGEIQNGRFVTETQLISDGWKRFCANGKGKRYQIWKKSGVRLSWNKDFGQCVFF